MTHVRRLAPPLLVLLGALALWLLLRPSGEGDDTLTAPGGDGSKSSGEALLRYRVVAPGETLETYIPSPERASSPAPAGSAEAALRSSWTRMLRKVFAIEPLICGRCQQKTVIEGSTRRDVPPFPPIALREAAVNAVVHADYSQSGSPIRVAVFEDRVEIDNPSPRPSA